MFSQKNVYMIVVPQGVVQVPRYLALSLVQSLTSDRWGADILLRSKEAITMNTGTLVRWTDKLLYIRQE